MMAKHSNARKVELKFMADKTCEVAIESTLGYMDYHLTLLHEALTTDNQEQVDFQREQLEKIREHLVGLGHFVPVSLLQEAN
jgi:hypothetical protein